MSGSQSDLAGGSAPRLAEVEVRGALVAVAAVCAVVALGAIGAPGGGNGRDGRDGNRDERLVDHASPSPSATPSWPESQPDPSWRSVALTDDMWRRALRATGADSTWRPLVSTRVPGSKQVVVLLGRDAGGLLTVATATFVSDRPGAEALAGTRGVYRSLSNLVAQPARLSGEQGAGVLVVLLPGDLLPGDFGAIGDTVTVTNSRPGERLPVTTGFVHDRMALVPIVAPEAVTRLRIQRAGRTVVDTVPAGLLLGEDVPRTLEHVVTTDGAFPQPVQVRTDGRTACRMTASTWWDGTPFAPWNPFDSACAPVDGRLHLLLPGDRTTGRVVGIAPPAAARVRLHWRDDDTTTVLTTRGDVNAFLGPQDGRPDQLLVAEALAPDGTVLASAIPPRPGT